MKITFNKSFDLERSKEIYQQDRRGRFTDVITSESADEIHLELKSLQYDLALIRDQQHISISPTEWASFDQQKKQQIVMRSHQYASKGEGYIYSKRPLVAGASGFKAIDAFTEWLNSELVLEWMRKVSGYDDIVAASAQATRYSAGQFLTRHNDINPTMQRRVAYVFNFTENWHPDWGGLLQFYEDDGTPRDCWSPGFNTLSLFDVKHVHAVTYVTPYALQPRLSITGWFRAKT